MVYQNKKDETVQAKVLSTDDKCNTVTLEYTTGPKKGKNFVVVASTLKRWWKLIPSDDNPLGIDPEEVNKPYKPDVKPHYIPKPDSVKEYEEKKNKRFNSSLPSFESLVDDFGSMCSKINETSKYIKFSNGSTLWRKNSWIDLYCVEEYFIILSQAGLASSPNKDKERPFHFRIENEDQYETFKKTIKED